MTAPKGKQRSIHMDDETFELLQALALKHKANNSTIVRMALAAYAGPPATIPYQEPSPAVQQMVQQADEARQNVRNIVLPDAKVSSFNVSGGRVRGKISRNEREDDGLDV